MVKTSVFFRTVFLTISLLIVSSLCTMILANEYTIIPYPQRLIPQSGKFTFNNRTVIVCSGQQPEILQLAQQFSDQMALVSGLKLAIKDYTTTTDTVNTVIFQWNPTQADALEAYKLSVSAKTIRISAASANGIFYGLQSMYQLLPPAVYGKQQASVKQWSVPAVQIVDSPRFGYRGLHLDVCRHFFPIAFIKKYIDAMAIHKFNNFHWHLTDDQGWRIEIKKYPLLTKVGSKRQETLVGYYFDNYPQQFDGVAYDGFYTQDEAREIVAYAKARFITVIPEIEMPGHAMAAIAAYPYLSCNRTPIKVATKWGVFKDVYCTRDSTFNFLEDVLTEVMDIFPGKYIHIGGDECPKDRWKTCPDCQARIKALNLKDENELQSYFTHRMEKFLNSKGRQIIGWDEILDGGLAPNATVMSWRGVSGGIAAAKSGHNVIMTPSTVCYFDHYQSDPVTEPVTIGGFLPLRTVYQYEPVPADLTPEQAKYILGAQANLWTEYMKNSDGVEYMAFPRVSAMAEVLWSQNVNRNWDRFRANMPTEFERYSALNIHPSRAYYDVQCQSVLSKDKKLLVMLASDNPKAEIRYTLDGSAPTKGSKLFVDSIRLTQSATVKAIALENGKIVSKEFSKSFLVSKVTGLNYIQNPINSWLKGDNVYSLTDGVLGNTRVYEQWVAIGSAKDGEIIIDLQKVQQISRASVGLLNAPGFNAMYPPEIKFFTSMDGITYNQVAVEHIKQRFTGAWELYRPELTFPLTAARYVKLQLKNAGITSNTDQNGGISQMFLDEIGVW